MLSGRYYPRSFTVLVLVAMSVLTVPLASGLVNAIYVLQGVVATQRQFTTTSLVVTRDTREVVDTVSQLQRTAGQYHLLRAAEFEPALSASQARLNARIGRLERLLADPQARTALTRLQTQEHTLRRKLRPGGFLDSRQFHALDNEFDAMHTSAGALLVYADRAVQREMRLLESEVRSTQRRLLWLALAMIPLTLLLAGVFSWMISRPIRGLKASIQQLGRADHRPLPTMGGPQDMVELGREMEWLRQRLLALEEQKVRFLRHVSHELKTPLASLREGVELLDDALVGVLNPRQQTIVEIMNSSSRELQKRIEDLIHYGSLKDGVTPGQADAFTLDALVDAVLARQRLPLEARRLRVERQTQTGTLVADRRRLETALDNLLSNAIKFSPEGGCLRIDARTQGAQLIVELCDQGKGIPVAERERVFEPFFQGVRQPNSAIKGSGLGLAIVRESLRHLGGEVSLVEREPWSTCFRLICPCNLHTP